MASDSQHPNPLPATFSRRAALKTGATGIGWLLSLSHITPALAQELARLAHDEPMTGARLAGILQTERTQWNALLAQISPAHMEEPGAAGIWSVKELVAHLTWYERRVVESAQQIFSTGKFTHPDKAGMSMDEWNDQIAIENRNRPLGDVLTEANQVFSQLLTLIAACPAEILNDPHRVGLPDDMIPWMGVANNSYAHYREHEPDLRAWLAKHQPMGEL